VTVDAGDPFPSEVGARTLVTVGTFDGVHLGHQHVLRDLRNRAAAAGLTPLVISFEPHPLEVLSPGTAPGLLAPGFERLEIMAELGIQRATILPFTSALAGMTAEQFFDFILRARYGMQELLVGYDHGFGRGRAGDVTTLRRIGAERGIAVDVVAPVSGGGGDPVSSSSIRAALARGDLEAATAGLGRSYSLSGRVVKGARRGRLLGFPTINVAPHSDRKLLPKVGVYAVRVDCRLGSFGGMMNLGPRPTFGEQDVVMEVNLFDAADDLYDHPVRVELVERIRDTRRFQDADALVTQLAADEKAARRALTQVV
jgi:riboflavin kinase / FMN adenylyltransferase